MWLARMPQDGAPAPCGNPQRGMGCQSRLRDPINPLRLKIVTALSSATRDRWHITKVVRFVAAALLAAIRVKLFAQPIPRAC